ncbi:GNAT family N-acetyltransferase [Primorskyibacter sp. 2E233]|uniref:GNAT family N-acetyltransferase n=1 Tax=Primorskyibacter sp. 2E233 TaxID=3413431 RepID=UPI003BF23DEF
MQPLFPKGQVTFRSIQDSDRDFLFRLYASTREWEFELTKWTDADKQDFLERQFKTQDMAYRMSNLNATFCIIQMDGTDIGRLYVDRQDNCLRIIEFTLAPEWRGRGIGSDILRSLLNEAHGGKVPVRLSVMKNSPALALYLRHHFTRIADLPMHYELEWRPDIRPREM